MSVVGISGGTLQAEHGQGPEVSLDAATEADPLN